MRISNKTLLRKTWLESRNVENLTSSLSTRCVIPVAEGKQTGLPLFILAKLILVDTHPLYLPDAVCSGVFPSRLFSEKISFGQLIISHLYSILFKVIHYILHFLIFGPRCLPSVCLQRLCHSEVNYTRSSRSQAEVLLVLVHFKTSKVSE